MIEIDFRSTIAQYDISSGDGSLHDIACIDTRRLSLTKDFAMIMMVVVVNQNVYDGEAVKCGQWLVFVLARNVYCHVYDDDDDDDGDDVENVEMWSPVFVLNCQQ